MQTLIKIKKIEHLEEGQEATLSSKLPLPARTPSYTKRRCRDKDKHLTFSGI